MKTLVIAEDHESAIEGIKLYLKFEIDIKILGFANNGEALCKMVNDKKPDIVITDIEMPGMDGIEATKKILDTAPDTKIIVFTMFDRDEIISEMFRLGVKGYILKGSSLKELLIAIRRVYGGQCYYDSKLSPDKLEALKKGKSILTTREKEILRLIAKGKSSKSIAKILSIAITTVGTHRKNIMNKKDLKGKVALILYAKENYS